MHHADAMGAQQEAELIGRAIPQGQQGRVKQFIRRFPRFLPAGKRPLVKAFSHGLVHPAPRFARVKAHDAAFPVKLIPVEAQNIPQPLAKGLKRAAHRGTPQGREMLNHVADLVEREGFLVQLFPGTVRGNGNAGARIAVNYF